MLAAETLLGRRRLGAPALPRTGSSGAETRRGHSTLPRAWSPSAPGEACSCASPCLAVCPALSCTRAQRVRAEEDGPSQSLLWGRRQASRGRSSAGRAGLLVRRCRACAEAADSSQEATSKDEVKSGESRFRRRRRPRPARSEHCTGSLSWLPELLRRMQEDQHKKDALHARGQRDKRRREREALLAAGGQGSVSGWTREARGGTTEGGLKAHVW